MQPPPPSVLRPKRRATTELGTTAASLVTLAPGAVLAATVLVPGSWALVSGIVAATLIAIGAVWHEHIAAGRWLVFVGMATVPLAAFRRIAESPALTLSLIAVVALVAWLIWRTPRAAELAERRLAALRGSALAAVGLWSLSMSMPSLAAVPAQTATLVSLMLSIAFTTVWATQTGTARSRAVLGAVGLVSIAAAIALRGAHALTCLAAIPVAALLTARSADENRAPSWLAAILEHPARLVVTTFLMLAAVGAALLALPISSSSGRTIGFLDAIFTSVSAVCVTGLIVVDTPKAFTVFGQTMILLLIQVGGLGIMSFYTVALQFLGRRLSLRHELTVAGTVGEGGGSVFAALRRVLVITAVSELVGALVLSASFVAGGEPLGSGVWRATFTAVSAFCNAGFALQTDSLIPYQQDAVVVHTVAILIVLGGLSPLAVVSMPKLLRRQPIPLQVKLIYAMTAVLLLFGAAAFGAFEWSDSLARLTRVDRVHNAWFQSVTLRTAGFNTVDLTETRESTRTLMMVMMLIGGSPGGTAGGIKTTTAAVLILAVVAALRGRAHVVAFGRHIRATSVYKAAAVATVGMLSVLGGVMAIQLTQSMAFDVGVFEVISGIATVGLSLGGTALLDEVGKVVIIFCMFLGRVGPLTMFLFLADRRPEPDWDYPEEAVDVG